MNDPANEVQATADAVAALEVGTQLLQGSRLVLGVAILVSAALLSFGAKKAIHFAWKAGADPERRLGLGKLAFDLLLASAVVWLGLRNIAEVAPGSSSLAVALLSVFAAVAIYPELQNLIAGFSISGAEQLRAGDRVALDDVQGEVFRLRLTHIDLRVEDGSIVFIPNRLFRSKIVKVERKRKVWPVSVKLNGKFSTEHIERLRIAAILCPFRSQHTDVAVEHGATSLGGVDGVWVKLSCWSETGAQAAIHYIEQLASTGPVEN